MRTAAAGFFANGTSTTPPRASTTDDLAQSQFPRRLQQPAGDRGVMQTADPNRHPITAGATTPTRPGEMSSNLSKKELEDLIQSLWVLVVDDNQYMRKMIR